MGYEIIAVDKHALAPVVERVNDYVSHSKADATIRAYREDWADFVAWCSVHGLDSKPAAPQTVAAYIADVVNQPVYSSTGKQLRDHHSVATIERRLASISKAHAAAGFDNPASRKHQIVKDTLAGIRRSHGVKKTRKAAVRVANIHAALTTLPDTLQGKRDRALLLLGYIGALRRSELVALNVEDIEFTPEGLRYTIRRSKTDQEGQGVTVGVNYGVNPATCPVQCLRVWLDTAGITSGPIFRPVNRHGQVLPERLGGRAVGLIVKRLAPLMGMDPETVGGHSLRAGLITDGIRAGMSPAEIMNRSRHRSVTVFNDYYREADIYAVDFGARVGL